MWEERIQDGDGDQIWRFSLEDPSTGQRRGFAHLDALTEFLQHVTTGRGENATVKGAEDNGARQAVDPMERPA